MMRILLVAAAVLLASACSEEVPQRPMVEVVVDAVTSEPYQPQSEYVGRLEARDDVAIQAKITGYLLTRDFREGELIQAGEVLYTLDASEYQAALARAEADLINRLEPIAQGLKLSVLANSKDQRLQFITIRSRIPITKRG